jgi:hypothetical protein
LNRIQKITQILTALAGWTGLALLMIVNLRSIRVNLELTYCTAILRSFTYFTVLSNLLVATAVTIPLFWPQRLTGYFFSKPQTLSGFLVYIMIVGLAYHFLLADAWRPQGLHKLADIFQHYVVPILFLLHWIFIPKGKLSWKAVPLWLVFPAVYLAFIMVRGTISNVYPYPFADVSRLGIRPVLINAGVFTLGFVVLGLATVGLDRLLGKTRLNRQLLDP